MEKIECPQCQALNSDNAKFCMNCGYSLPIVVPQETFVSVPEPTKKSSTKTIAGVIVGVVIAAIIGIVVQRVLMQPKKELTIENNLMLKGVVDGLNKSCPIMVDAETRLDNCMVMPNKTLQYNYTLINVAKGDVDTNDVLAILRPSLINQLKDNPQMNMFRKEKVNLMYLYKDKDGGYLFSTLVKGGEY